MDVNDAIVKQALDNTGIFFKYYPNQHLFNVTDEFGRVHSFYASTGTAMFRFDAKGKYSKQKSVKGISVSKFIWYLDDLVRVDNLFAGEQ